MATNKNNVNTVENNLFILSGDEEETTPYDWDGMPEFDQPLGEAYHKVIVRLRNADDVREFAKRMDQPNITEKTKAIWFPALERGATTLMRWMDDEQSEEK